MSTMKWRLQAGMMISLLLAANGDPTPAQAAPAAARMDQVQFQIKGRAREVYLIQASSNLVNWTIISTNEAAADGTVSFTDAQATRFGHRFYRGLRLNVSAAGLLNNRIHVKPK